MNVRIQSHPAGFSVYTVSVEDSVFELSTFGGQLRSWTKGGVPILFANTERAVADGSAAYRGGAPICFPYFGKGVLLPSEPLSPQHGRARTSVWAAEVLDSSIVLRTEQAPGLACELQYEFGDGVRISGRVTNVGEVEVPFQLAVHSYWACEEPNSVRVLGLGSAYLDNLAGLRESVDGDSGGGHVAPFDRIYTGAADELEVATERYRVAISTQGCSGAVLWNPGTDHGLADLGSPDFVCVESGVVVPSVRLGPGEGFELEIEYRAELV